MTRDETVAFWQQCERARSAALAEGKPEEPAGAVACYAGRSLAQIPPARSIRRWIGRHRRSERACALASAGVFAALAHEALFNRAFVEYGAVTWPGEIDIAPDAMHAEIEKNGEWIVPPCREQPAHDESDRVKSPFWRELCHAAGSKPETPPAISLSLAGFSPSPLIGDLKEA